MRRCSIFANGDRGADAAQEFAGEVAEIMAAHAGTNRRLGVDKIMLRGARALEAAGFVLEEGEELTERARFREMRRRDTRHALRRACLRNRAQGDGGRHRAPAVPRTRSGPCSMPENIRRGGEWIETRLFASGRAPTLVPECGPRWCRELRSAPRYRPCGLLRLCVDIRRHGGRV